MNRRSRQQGMTLFGWLTVLVLVGAGALLVLKVVPVYLESFKVARAIESVTQDPSLSQMTKRDIYKKFVARMNVEDVDRFHQRNVHKFLNIQRTGNKVTLSIEYQTVTPLIGNVSLLIDFRHEDSNQ